MDPYLIFEKTAAGEDAVKQRTRVVQRNTRMVLILIDGKSSIAELYEKTGSPQIVDAAIQDLERDGLIVPKIEEDSVWEQSRRIAEEIKAAAMSRLVRDNVRPPPEPEAGKRVEPVVPAASAMSQPPEPFSVIPLSVAPFSTFGAAAPAAPLAAQPAAVASPPPAEIAVKQSRFAKLFARHSAADDDIEPIRRGAGKGRMSWPLAIFVALLGIVVTLVAVFLFYPYDSLKPQIEAELSRIAGRPMKVGAIAASVSPKPAITLSGVRGDDASAASAARIHLLPELFSLLGSQPKFISIEVEGASVPAAALAALPKIVAATVSGDGALTQTLRLSGVDLLLAGVTLRDLQVEFGDKTDLTSPLTLISSDRSLRLAVQAQPGGFVADVEALGWVPAAESRYRFDSLQARIVWDGARLALSGIDARIFDGSIQGEMAIDDRPGAIALEGDLSVRRVNLKRLADALDLGARYAGELGGNVRLVAQGDSWEEMLKAVSGDGQFSVVRGSLGGFDLVEAVRRGKGIVQGGETRFEQMSGRLTITRESLRLANIELSSGLLRAGGVLDIGRETMAVSGRIDVEMRGTANVVRMSVTPTGTLKDPALQAGR